jgi:hypothetical protein
MIFIEEKRRQKITAVANYPRFISVGFGARADLPTHHVNFEYKRQSEFNITLSMHGLLKKIPRIIFQVEFPLIPTRIETRDKYTTLTNEQGESRNEYRLQSYNLNVLYDLINPSELKRWNLFSGISGVFYRQIPLKAQTQQIVGSESFVETRDENSAVGIRGIFGVWYEIGKRFRIDGYAGYSIYPEIISESFVFNYFGNATPVLSSKTLNNILLNARLSLFIK